MTAACPGDAKARADAFALTTATVAEVPGARLPIVLDWFDTDSRPCARTVALAEQLTLLGAMLTTLLTARRGHVGQVVIPGHATVSDDRPAWESVDGLDEDARRCAAAAAVVAARLTHDHGGEARIYDEHLGPGHPRGDAAAFLLAQARLAAALADLIATESHTPTHAVLAELGLAAALAEQSPR